MGITWGIWQTQAAQRRANYVCAAVGLVVMSIGAAALFGMFRANVTDAQAYEIVRHQQQEHLKSEEARIKAELIREQPGAQKTAARPVAPLPATALPASDDVLTP